MSESKKPKTALELYSILDSNDIQGLALELRDFIRGNNLYQNIQGKEFVNVEGWQYAGQRLGIAPIGVYCKRLERADGEIAYEAATDLLDLRRDQKVGNGVALCSNKENSKRNYAEFAIMSMAQTRAIGKAYRLLLAYIIRAAGFEPTPAEEMDAKPAEAAPAPTTGGAVPVKAAPAAKSTGTPAGQGGPGVENPPGINQSAKDWFDDVYQDGGSFDLDKVAAKLEADNDLDAARFILATYRMKKAHRAEIERVFRLLAGRRSNQPKAEASKPTKTDDEFRDLLNSIKASRNEWACQGALNQYDMRPAVRKAFELLLADIQAEPEPVAETSSEKTPAAVNPAKKKAAPAPEPEPEPDEIDQEPKVTARQFEILVELGNWTGFDRKAKLANLKTISQLTAIEAEARIEDFIGQIKKTPEGVVFVNNALKN